MDSSLVVLTALAVTSTLFTSTLAAQSVNGDLRTTAAYGVFARQGAQSDFKSWPTTTVLPQGQTSLDALADNVAVSTLVGWNAFATSVSCDVSEQGVADASNGPGIGGSTASPSSTNVQQGAHSLLFTVRGAPGLRGKLQVWASGLADPGATVTMAADVGDDSSIDFQVTTPPGVVVFDRRQLDLRLDANGALPVRIVTDAVVALGSGSTRWKTGISVVFTPGAFCDIAGYGASCGPHLTGGDDVALATRTILLQLGDAPANATGALVVGAQRTGLPLPGTSCLLLTDPLVVLPFTTDVNGFAQHKLNAPSALAFAVDFQDVLLPAGPSPMLTSSNGVAVSCR